MRAGDTGEALVMAQVEVGLGAIVGDKDFAMLKGRHGARIDVQIGVKLAQPTEKPRACSKRP